MALDNIGQLPEVSLVSEKKKGRLRIPSIEKYTSREEPKWTVFSGSQNLSAALNDPAGREPDLFTKTWGSYFIPTASLPSSTLPTIELADFLRYLKETAAGRKVHRSVVRQLKREQQENEEGMAVSPLSIAPLVSMLKQDGRTYDLSSIPRIFMQADFSLADPVTFHEVLPLSQLLPKKKKQQTSDIPATTNHQSSTLLHEKLTHYLDIVEVHLAYHISQRSDMFFSTLSSQQEMQTHIMQVRQEVEELRHKLRQLDSSSTHGGLKLCRMCVQRRNYLQVYNKLKLISTVQQTQPTIQLLLSTSDFVGALDLISTTQEVLEQELQGVQALRHLGSQLAELEKAIEKMMEADFVHFAHEDISQRLQSTQSQETSTYSEERLISVVYGLLRQGKLRFLIALREHLLSFLKREVKTTISSYLQVPLLEEVEGDDQPTLADTMKELDFDAWLAMLKHVFDKMLSHLTAVQESLYVISRVCERASGKQATPTQEEVRDISGAIEFPIMMTDSAHLPPVEQRKDLIGEIHYSEAEDLLAQLTMDEELSDARLGELSTNPVTASSGLKSDSHISRSDSNMKAEYSAKEILDRRGSKSVVMATREELSVDPSEKERLEDSLSVAHVDEHSAIISTAQCHQLLADCHDIINASCDMVHARCAKILGIRVRAGLLEDLASSDFVALVRLTENFVSKSSHITGRHCPNLRVALLTQAKKFLEHFHNTRRGKLGLLLDGERWKQAEVPTKIQDLVNTLESGILLPVAGHERPLTPDLHSQSSSRKYLVVHGHNFAVVGVVLLLVKMLLEYCQCADDLPMLVTEVMSKVVDTLKHFNSLTSQLVLGAGALTAVGLKTITARHLALVTRCLQAIMLLIPDIKNHFKWRLSVKQQVLLSQFDLVTEDFSCHCREINSKVMNIMDELIQKQLTRWEAKNPTPSTYFRTLVKQILKLHENLVDILPQPQLEALFNSIEQIFKSRLRLQLTRLGITNNGSTQHGIVNSELSHIKGALSSLENTTAFGSTLFDIWTVSR